MLKIGAHLSVGKGFENLIQTAINIDSNVFQFFSRNPRGSKIKEFDENDIALFQKLRLENKFGPLLAHAPYTINLAGSKDYVYDFAKQTLKEDITRMDSIGIEYFNIHPGSHVGSGIEVGIKKIIDALNYAMYSSEKIIVLLETMSGKGSEIGFKFEQLKNIMDGAEHEEKIGVCMDLCHVFSAGYDIVNNFDGVLEEFDKIIGIKKLKAIHLNDSMYPFNSHKDRHAPIGQGYIGLKAILDIMSNRYISHLPFYLETPFDDEGHKNEISMLKNMLYNKI